MSHSSQTLSDDLSPDPEPPDSWPGLSARCSARIDLWRVPPRWTRADWRDEARAQGALAACEALRDFDPARGVPLGRLPLPARHRLRLEPLPSGMGVVRRLREIDPLPDPVVSGSSHLDPVLFEQLAPILDGLPDADRGLIDQLFWAGRTEDDLAAAFGITQQGVNKRKRLVIGKLRRLFGSVA